MIAKCLQSVSDLSLDVSEQVRKENSIFLCVQSALHLVKTYNSDTFTCIDYTTLSALIDVVRLLGKREIVTTLSDQASVNVVISVIGLLGFFFSQTDIICFKNNLFLVQIDELCETI